MPRQRVSDQLKAQDQRTADGVVLILRALLDRYPGNADLTFAAKLVAEFGTSLGAVSSEEPRA